MSALEDPNNQVRAAAAQSLGSSAVDVSESLQRVVFDSLLAAIDDANDFVCAAAIHSLGRLKVEESREQIIDCLGDSNSHVVEAAILALARLGPLEIGERLSEFLESENDWILASAVRAMGMLEVVQAGPKLVSILEKSLGKPATGRHDFLISNTIQAVARLEVVEAVPLLIQIAHQEVGLRTQAVQALIEMNDSRVAPLLVDMLADPGSSLRTSLVKMMIKAHYQPAIIAIRPLLHDSNGQVRSAALDAVVVFKDSVSEKVIRQMCYSDPNPFLRSRAVHGLVILAGHDAVPDLIVLARDPNTFVRQAVVETAGSFSPIPQEVVDDILLPLAETDVAPLIVSTARNILDNQVDPSLIRRKGSLSRSEAVRPIPSSTQQKSEQLLADLDQWQQGLGDLVSLSDPKVLSQVDQALTILIRFLEEMKGDNGG